MLNYNQQYHPSSFQPSVQKQRGYLHHNNKNNKRMKSSDSFKSGSYDSNNKDNNDYGNNSRSSNINSNHKNTTIGKISNFIQIKSISISQFWSSNRNHASSQDILTFCSNCGLKLTVHDDIALKFELFANRQVISINDFCQLITPWREEGNQMITNFLKERSDELIQQIEAKRDKKRPQSGNYNGRGFSAKSHGYGHANTNKSASKIPRGFSAINRNSNQSYNINSTNNNNNKQSPNLQNSRANQAVSVNKLKKQTITQNNSLSYLQKHRQKQWKMQKSLAQTIDKTKNQYQYTMLLKMGQANQICKDLQSAMTFRAYKNAEGNIKVRVFNYNNLDKQITLKQFERDYKSLKKKNKQNKLWDQNNKSGKQSSFNYNKHSQLLASANYNQGMKQYELKNAKKMERQEQLRNLLVNTVNLTNLLKEQIKIFKMKGIHGCQDF